MNWMLNDLKMNRNDVFLTEAAAGLYVNWYIQNIHCQKALKKRNSHVYLIFHVYLILLSMW